MKSLYFLITSILFIFLCFSSVFSQDIKKQPDYISCEVLVKFIPETNKAQKQEIREKLGAELIKIVKSINLEHWKLPQEISTQDALEILKHIDLVEHAEPNYLYIPKAVPNDPDFSKSWFLQNTGQLIKNSSGKPGADISAPQAWDIETGSHDMIIAVIDSGVAFEHPDLIHNIWINTKEIPDNGIDDDNNDYIDDIHGWDFINNDNNPSDYSKDLSGDGHGTHVAGIIAARGNNHTGTTGVMWQAQIMPLQIFDLFETTSFLDTIVQNINIISAVEYAVNNGAKIINCSFGGTSDSRFQYDAYEYANKKGVLAIVASGNEGNNNDNVPIYPANYDLPNIISVAATDEMDNLASYSNYGKNSVDIAAPGGSTSFTMYSTTPPARKILFYEDFESGDDKWIKDAVYENWSLAYNSIFESNIMQDSAGNYSNNENSYIQTKNPIDAENYRGLHIQFLTKFQLEPNCDFLFVEGSDDGGNTFSTNFPVTGFMTGFSTGIERLLSWGSETQVGSSFYLRFRLKSDDSKNYDGIALDDIKLTGIKWEFTGNEYNYKSGTSMAAPVVSAIAGLIWSNQPDLTHIEVKNTILNSADKLDNLKNKVLTGGRINAAKALGAVSKQTIIEPEDNNSEILTETLQDKDSGGGCFIKSLSFSLLKFF